MKVPILNPDAKFRRVWAACFEAQRLVASWPAWRRSEDVPPTGRPPLPAVPR